MSTSTVSKAEVIIALNAIVTTLLLSDPSLASISNKLTMLEPLLSALPKGELRDTLYETIRIHRGMLEERH